jgi:hypothetical protein
MNIYFIRNKTTGHLCKTNLYGPFGRAGFWFDSREDAEDARRRYARPSNYEVVGVLMHLGD